ncbi:DUF429 domain-containing protein [Pseudoroseomonas wenyumeiae]
MLMTIMDTYIGFDSAWTDNPRAPGAICAVSLEDGRAVRWHAPELVSFDKALDFIRRVRAPSGVTLIALDQPTIVANRTGMRPVEKVAASLVSWLGGGVQPSNTGRKGMFCHSAPVWRFLAKLGATEDPEVARTAVSGLFVTEVFPALALASLHTDFFGRLSAPRYNPARKRTFLEADWTRVATVAAGEASQFNCEELSKWCSHAASLQKPAKADQDRLDAALCTLIALSWRCRPRQGRS